MLLLELNAVFLTEYFQMNQLQASFVFVWRTISPSLVPGSVVSRPTLSRETSRPGDRPIHGQDVSFTILIHILTQSDI